MRMLIVARHMLTIGVLEASGRSLSKGASPFPFWHSPQPRGLSGLPKRYLERIARWKRGFQLAVQFHVETLLF